MIDLIGDRDKCRKLMLLSLLLGLVVFGIAWLTGAYHSGAENILERPGGMIGFAFVGCWLLIIVAKLIMTPLLQRDEDYYRKGDDDPDA